MPYSSDVANLIADQLTKFISLNRHQLAGQVANLDFWVGEVRHALDVIDGYGVRFVRLSMNQEHFLKMQDTGELRTGPILVDAPRLRIADPPASNPLPYARPVRRIPDRELQQARRNLTDAVFKFLSRCFREALISEKQFAGICKQLGLAGES